MIRRAIQKDAGRINELLYQVDDIHNKIRPDLFKAGKKKYTDEEVERLIEGGAQAGGQCLGDAQEQIFVYESEDGEVLGYTICMIEEQKESYGSFAHKTVYIDDLCVDERARGQHIGRQLYEYVRDYARAQGCNSVTLNVWEGNDSARKFYEGIGMKPRKTFMEERL